MALETRSTDAKGCISLPKAFANATVIIEQVNENEIPDSQGACDPGGQAGFAEEAPIVVSNRDSEQFFQALITHRNRTPLCGA